MKLLDEEVILECRNTDNDVPIVLQLIDTEIVNMVINTNKTNQLRMVAEIILIVP